MIVGPLELRTPMWLMAAPALWALTWWLARSSLAGLGPVTRRVALVMRALVIGLLALALAEPVWRLTSDDVAVSVVMDASRSVPRDRLNDAETRLTDAATGAGAEERLGVVTTAREALVQALPSRRVRTIRVGDAGNLDATDLAAGIRLALASAPEDAALRIALVSDGNETVGSALAAARVAAAAGVPIDVYVVGYSHDSEVILEDIVAPATARRGETVTVRFLLSATEPTIGRLNLLLNGAPVDLDPDSPGLGATVELNQGMNTVAIPVRLSASGPQRFDAVFEPIVAADDALPQNNRQSAVTFVTERGRVLVYVGDGADPAATPIVRALESADISAETRPASEGHESLIELGAYDAVVLVDSPAWDFSQKQQEELRAYVHDLGGGLVMIGGPLSFGAGGWIGSPVADALPVKLDPPQKRVMPRGALALIMHSTEMPDGNAAGREVARAAANALSRLDLVGVLEYAWQAGGAAWVYPIAPVGNGAAVNRAIDNLSFGDMPDFDSAMGLALNGLTDAAAAQKHVIIISDGDPSGPSRALVQRFVDQQITISTVAVYPHENNPNAGDMLKMRAIAEETGGRFYAVPFQYSLNQLPQIFIKEAQTVKRSLIWEGDPVTPTVEAFAAEPMRGISAVPPVSGYVVTADREGLSQVTLRGPQEDPILAQWQYGLGRAVAFTSDAAPRWAPAWPAWNQARAFWAQHVRWAMRPSGSANLTLYTQRQGDETRVIVEALDSAGERMNFARFAGRVVTPGLDSAPIELTQTGPGRYEGVFTADEAGSYLVNLRYDAPRPGGEVERGSAQIAVTRAFADEFRALRDNLPLLTQIAQLTGGRVLSDADALDAGALFDHAGLTPPVRPAPIWLPVALIGLSAFLIDVGVRRVRVDLGAIRAWVVRLVSRSTETRAGQTGSLRAARDRAREQLKEQAAATMGGMSGRARDAEPLNPATAGVKFDAGDAAPPPPIAPGPARAVSEEEHPPEDEGLSRLLRAKRRARDEMERDDDA